MQRDSQHARERSESDGSHEQERENEGIDASQRIQEPARRIVQARQGRNIAARENRHRDRQQRSERGPNGRHADRFGGP
jgi:hypothetical protein